MKKSSLSIALIVTTLITGTALADDDCNDPVADWQSRETLRQMLEAKGWTVNRIKVDEGCYEVKGLDQNGNKVKAEYFPASLQLRKLETKFGKHAQVPEQIYQRNTPPHTKQRSTGEKP